MKLEHPLGLRHSARFKYISLRVFFILVFFSFLFLYTAPHKKSLTLTNPCSISFPVKKIVPLKESCIARGDRSLQSMRSKHVHKQTIDHFLSRWKIATFVKPALNADPH